MNKERRKALQAVITKLDEAYYRLEEILSEEQEAFDNMPEGLQLSIRGSIMEEGISTMEDALSSIEDTKNLLEELA